MATNHITEQTIRDALERDEFIYHYQPKVSLITGKVIGAEALIRWISTDGEIIYPNEFIPLAEQVGLINQISCHMFRKLVRDLLIFFDLCPDLVVSFNASANDFRDERFIRLALESLQQLKIPPRNLQIEITESTVLSADDEIKKHILALCDTGMELAMDDYGTGYSTLDTLSQWPFTTIKLDRGIISRMLDSPKSQTIVESSIRMAHELDVNIVAEGVESDKQYQMLLESGCTKVQGYWISLPLPLDDFIYFIQQDLRWSGLPIGLIHMATVDHIQWRKRLVSEVVRIGATAPDSEERKCVTHASLDHHDCRLGKWYYGVGQHFKGCPDFDAIEEPHRQFHALGAQLFEIVKSGGSVQTLTPYLSEFSLSSGLILNSLQKLEHKGLVEMHCAHKAWEEHHLYPTNPV